MHQLDQVTKAWWNQTQLHLEQQLLAQSLMLLMARLIVVKMLVTVAVWCSKKELQCQRQKSLEEPLFKGGHLNSSDTQHTSTNEKVIIRKDEIKVGTYTVHVYGNKFFDSSIKADNVTLSQNFSVVATGDIENKYIEFAESTDAPCADADPNRPGYCLCKEDEIGPLCQAKVKVIVNNDGETSFTLQPREIQRVLFKMEKVVKEVKLYVAAGTMHTAAWISPECHLAFHEYETHVNCKNRLRNQGCLRGYFRK